MKQLAQPRTRNSIFPVRLFPSGKIAKQRQILTNWSSWQKSLVLVWIIWF
ncbi:hypothetical protein SSUST1_0005 [Streptococcus suis ST1]|nr:hypothetical protein SSUST1_0005 [Streptococcus suis ST1]